MPSEGRWPRADQLCSTCNHRRDEHAFNAIGTLACVHVDFTASPPYPSCRCQAFRGPEHRPDA